MSKSRDRVLESILERLSTGVITRQEAEEMIGSLAKRARTTEWLFFPMERLPLGLALGLSAAAAVAQLALSRLQVRFDGALDLHVVREAVPWGTALLELALAWPVTALLLFAAARPLAKAGRFVDFLAAVGVARLPHVLAGALGGFFRPTLVEAAERAAAEGSFPGAALAISGAMLPLSLWFFALLVTGIHTVAGLRGGRLALAAVVGLLVAEVLSKVALAVFV